MGGGAWWFLLREDAGASDAAGPAPTEAPPQTPREPETPSGAAETVAPEAEVGEPAPTATGSASSAAEAPPLDIDADYVNQYCNDEYVVILATSGLSFEWESKLGDAVAGVPNARYLAGGSSCRAFLARSPESGEHIYNAYVGPFPDLSSACTALSGLDSEKAWVRRLSRVSPERELCMCATEASAMPVVSPSDTDTDRLDKRRALAQAQWVFYKLGINDRESIYGNFTQAFDLQLRQYQADQGLVERPEDGGRLGPETWAALQSEYCDNPDYDEYRR